VILSKQKFKHFQYSNEDFATLLVMLLRSKHPSVKVNKKQNVTQVTFSTWTGNEIMYS